MVPSEGLHFTLRGADRHIDITCTRGVTPLSGLTFYVALQLHADAGAAVIPFDAHFEGSTVFLPFRATHFHFIAMSDAARRSWQRHFDGTMWSARAPGIVGATEAEGDRRVRLRIPLPEDPRRSRIRVAVYAKEISENCGWGRMLPSDDGAAPGGYDDQYLRAHYSVTAQEITLVPHRIAAERVKIYQLFPRLFSNLTATCEQNGALDTNGAGKFSQINDAALRSLRAMNFTHLWLTGILRQATGSDFSTVGLPADDPDLLKGIAGSPYAITDYFDVSPELADDPAKRLEEFCALVARIKAHRFGLIIDFVANHVARSYRSTIRPELTFGAGDDRTRFFDPQNNFYHLHGGGLRLPTWKDGAAISSTCKVLGTCDGLFDLEREQARVTGNDVASREPKLYDWYETVKLNYGYDFTTRQREYPHGEHRQKAVPDTWWKMDRVLEYWQTLGVDGFRCDMAHMVPPEFWAWCIGRARARADDVLFIAEAYNNDPMKVVGGDPLLAALDEHRGSVMFDLLNAGFSAVYDDPAYRRLKAIYDGGGWANDLDAAFGHDFIFHNALRYAENHDEVRLAARGHWDSIGMRVGRAVSGILYALSRGPVLLYNGQEVGEPAAGAEGFGGDDARTTIFDYWSMPELRKWVSEHRYDGADLSPEQHDLRAFYAKLLRLVSEPAFQHGEFFALNRFNIDNPRFGRLFDESASGHWLYAFLRRDQTSGQAFLVATNLHRSETMQEVSVRLPAEAVGFLALSPNAERRSTERLSAGPERSAVYRAGSGAVDLGDIPPLTPCYFELQIPSAGG